MSLFILCSRMLVYFMFCIKSPGCIWLQFVDLVPIATEKVNSRVVSGRILLVFDRILLTFSAVFGISERVLWRKDPAFALKHYKSMWQYLVRNLKADVNFLVLLNLGVYGNWCRHATQSSIIRLAWTLSLKYLSVKPRLLMKKGLFLEVESQLGKSFKVSG